MFERARETAAARDEFSRIRADATPNEKGSSHDFNGWRRQDLLFAIAKSRRHIVGTEDFDDDTLRGIVDTMYEGLPMPSLSPTFKSVDEFIIFDRGIRRLQREIKLHIEFGWVRNFLLLMFALYGCSV